MSVLARRKKGQPGGLSDKTSDVILIVLSLIIPRVGGARRRN